MHDSTTNWKGNRASHASIIGKMHEHQHGHLGCDLRGELDRKEAKKRAWRENTPSEYASSGHVFRSCVLASVFLQLALFSHYFPAQFQHRISAAHA